MPRCGTLLFSPHPDDAVYSLGAALQQELLPAPVVLVTLFGCSNFLRRDGFSPDWRTVTRRRRREDEAYAASLGLELVYHELPEASLRGQALFAARGDGTFPPPPGFDDAVATAFDRWAPTFVVAPLGLGDHCDHRIVCRAVAARFPRAAFYEDLPYVAGLSARKIRRRVAAVDPTLVPRDFPVGSVDAKLTGLRLYDSQVEEADLDLVRRHHRRRPVERIWVSSA